MNSFCSFCSSAGITGPHDHFLRASRAAGAAIICPKLKTTRCNFCNVLGHTAKFCTNQKSQLTAVKKAMADERESNFQAGNWLPAKTTKKFGNISLLDMPKLTSDVSRFSALEFESDSDSDTDSDPDIDDVIAVDIAKNMTWEQVVRGKPASPMQTNTKSWSDIVKKYEPKQEDDDFELPPLIWGKKFSYRWADVA